MLVTTARNSGQAEGNLDSPVFWEPSIAFLKFAIVCMLVGSAVFEIALFAFMPDQPLRACAGLLQALVAVTAGYLLTRGRVKAAVQVLCIGGWAYITVSSWFLGGVGSTLIIMYPLTILLTGWLIGMRAAMLITGLTAAATLGFALFESSGLLPVPPPTPPVMRWVVQCFAFILVAALIYQVVRAYRDRIEQVRRLGDDLAVRAADLLERETILNRAQAVANVGSWVYDIVGDRMTLSAETCRIFGLPAGTTGNQALYRAHVYPADRKRVERDWQAALKGERPFDHEHRIRAGRVVRWVRQKAEFERDSDGKPLRSVGITQDITDRKQAEIAVRESEIFKQAILDSVDAQIAVLDQNGVIRAVNQPWRRFARENGIDASELPSPSIDVGADYIAACQTHTEIAADSARDAREGIRAVLDGRLPSFSIDYPCHSPQQKRWFTMVVAPLDESAQGGVVVAHTNISNIKQAEAELARLNSELETRVASRTAELEEVNKELSEFSYAIAHDLRAPVRAMNGFSSMVLKSNEGKLDQTSIDHLRRVVAGSERIGQLIDDLLKLTRLSRQEMRQQNVDLSEMAASVAAALSAAHPERTVQVTIQSEIRAKCDSGLLRVVLENLIGNAWKFTAKTASPKIAVGAERRDGVTFYYVSDNGAGFDMQYVNKLFAPFQRLHHANEFEGTGIGLATVKKIIQRHGGRIWVESAVDHGTAMFFTMGEAA